MKQKQRHVLNKNQYSLKRFAPGTGLAIEQFTKLANDVWNGGVTVKNTDCQAIINAITDYVYDSEIKNKWITKRIRDAPELNNKRVYYFEPGTGKGTTQFYKFAKAIVQGKITCNTIELESLLAVIRNYVFDQIE